MSHRFLFLVIDGLGDLPQDGLSRRTPLQAAATPILDAWASGGLYGLVDPIQSGVVPNTHSGTGVLLGLYPEQFGDLRRGPIEAAGAGLALSDGDVALRANFATLEHDDGTLHVVDRRAGRIDEETAELAEAIDGLDLGDGVSSAIVSTDQHRCALVLKGEGLSGDVTDTDPGDHGMPGELLTCRARSPVGERTAEKLQQFVLQAHALLQDHPVNRRRRMRGLLPANGLLTRGAGQALPLRSGVHDRGMTAAVVAGCNTVLGLGRLLGHETLFREEFTADPNTDVASKLQTAEQALQQHDLVFVHFKAPDVLSHDRDPAAKRDFLERIDRELSGLSGKGFGLAVTADHTTDSGTGAHTADPVPSLISQLPSGDAIVGGFDEPACLSGALTGLTGHAFLQKVLDQCRDG